MEKKLIFKNLDTNLEGLLKSWKFHFF